MSSADGQDFVVRVSGAFGSEEDWKRVLSSQESGTAEVSPGAVAEKRLETRGRNLGEHVKSILEVLGAEYRLLAVIWDGAGSRWLIRIQSPKHVAEIPVPAEVGDGVAESGSINDLERLKNLVLFGAGRQDLIFKRREA